MLIAAALCAALSCKTLDNQDTALDEKCLEMEMIVNKYKPVEGSGVTIDLDGFMKVLSNGNLVRQTDLAKFEECISSFVNTSNRDANLLKDLGCETLFTELRSRSGQDYVDFWEKNAAAIQSCDSIQKLQMDRFIKEALRPCREWVESIDYTGQSFSRKRNG